MNTKKINEIVWRKDLYPRFEADPATIQKYAESVELLPPIEINQHNELIDGYHRWVAHKKAGCEEINVTVTKTESDVGLLALACERNSKHGMQLEERDKSAMAKRLFNGGAGLDKQRIAKILSILPDTVTRYLKDIEEALKKERRRRIFDLWMQCQTQEEIAQEVKLTHQAIAIEIETFARKRPDTDFCKTLELDASDHEDDRNFKPQIYDVWNFAENTNSTKHFGNTAVEIVDNLLYTFTQPFDIVIDPFAGGGSTIDICKERLRRYWASDRKPPVERQDIRQHDVVTDGIAGPSRWADVAMVYLDPPVLEAISW